MDQRRLLILHSNAVGLPSESTDPYAYTDSDDSQASTTRRLRTPSENTLPRSISSEAKPNMIESPPTGFTWVAYEHKPKAGRKTTTSATSLVLNDASVRKHAALAGAAARKAKLARIAKFQARRPLSQTLVTRSRGSTATPVEAQGSRSPTGYFDIALHNNAYRHLASYIASTMAPDIDYAQPARATRAVHAQLWTAFTSSTVLYNAALFMVGIHTNTWGLPHSVLDPTLGSGLLLLPEHSRIAMKAAVARSNGDSTSSVAIAILNDQSDAGHVHVDALHLLSVSPGAFEVNKIAALTYIILDGFRASLNDFASDYNDLVYSTNTYRADSHSPGTYAIQRHFPSALPMGFRIFYSSRPEVLSLLHLTAEAVKFNPMSPVAPALVRRLWVEIMAWSPSHSLCLSPSPSDESKWDPKLLSCLYHIRAAVLGMVGILLVATFAVHGMEIQMDLQDGVNLLVFGCRRMRTQELMGTEYEQIAFWSRYVLCALARDASSDRNLRAWAEQVGVRTWEDMRGLLQNHVYLEPWAGAKMKDLWENLYRDVLDPAAQATPQKTSVKTWWGSTYSMTSDADLEAGKDVLSSLGLQSEPEVYYTVKHPSPP